MSCSFFSSFARDRNSCCLRGKKHRGVFFSFRYAFFCHRAKKNEEALATTNLRLDLSALLAQAGADTRGIAHSGWRSRCPASEVNSNKEMASKGSANARSKVYEDELMSWLERHGCHIKDKVAFDTACRMRHSDIAHSLRHDTNPDAVLSYLLDSTEVLDTNSVSPRQLGRQATALIDKELQRSGVGGAALSASLILAQRKRKDLIARLVSGENLVEDEKDIFQTIHSPAPANQSAKSLSPQHRERHTAKNSTGPTSPDTQFQPRWDHFNTMKTRWRYIQPQVRSLIDDQNLVAPSTSTSYMRVGKSLLSGNYIDYKHFESTMQAQQSKAISCTAKSLLLSRQREQAVVEKLYVPKPCIRYSK